MSTPFGYMHDSCVREVPNGAAVEDENGRGVTRIGGHVISDVGACAYPTLAFPTLTIGSSPQSGVGRSEQQLQTVLNTGWKAWTQDEIPVQTKGHSRCFSRFEAILSVPSFPVRYVAQTVYIFPALTNDGSGSGYGEIIQPVLQYGPSAAGGGNYWAYASWYLDDSNTAY